ncbi:hypothetical protein CC1G_10947 [Coprinopsis cinerea okayama7|uniref:MYND-type domain-containing protein n=1 Tax=Coprinopsis cinerea (strain Okayama-7 / 130 / ATCC MYA-4618 / FGSC 9003) TaxID=240176 RepID=A8NT61_COPC7|nr:hypothetical protein CC1G_10947 [Coprinopsis cinerea okayama7\|eukprot:XP_001836166.2 hypothetical protein CC1G_10947 [Coprinopsis cinerea okayama7\
MADDMPDSLLQMIQSMGGMDVRNTVVPYGGRPKYVKLAPGDTGKYLPPIFFEDPRKHKPEPGPLGEIHTWGLYPYEYEGIDDDGDDRPEDNFPCFDGTAAMMRTMSTQHLYFGKPGPEQQWVKVLVERKKEQLKDLDLSGLDKQDVVIKIEMRVRNLHCYHFTDYRDGSLFGPEKSDSIDMVHIAQVGYKYLPDSKYMLAHLFAKEGDKIGYLYDFGDKWFHVLTIERILPLTDSHGSIEILDGKGACPGENMQGTYRYDDFLKDYYYKDNATEKLKKKREILKSPNYTGFAGKASTPPSLFDPAHFDIEAARARLAEALSSTNSVRSGSKKFNMPFPFGVPLSADKPLDPSRPGPSSGLYRNLGKNAHKTQVVKTFEPGYAGYWEELESNVKDKRRETLCAHCGKPGDEALKQCGGCRQVLYCSPEHQKFHWRAMHKNQCSRRYLKKDD